jgi:alcohol dehydrogenase
MRSFEFHNPTRISFGPGKVKHLSRLVEGIRNVLGDTGLIIHGSDRVRRDGTLDLVMEQLNLAGCGTHVFGGVSPNPDLATLDRAMTAIRSTGADFVVALGGGSVMDLAKAAAAGVLYDGQPWDMVFHGQQPYKAPQKALPLIAIPTLAATGSEMDPIAVITNPATGQKSFMRSDALYPVLSVLDPSLTISVPPDQTAYGVSDMISHVTETLFNHAGIAPLQDGFAWSVVRTALEFGPRAVRDGSDIEARTQLQWTATVALNGWVQAGADAPFPVHGIEHVLSAWYNIPHGAGLAVLNPAWMSWAARHKPERFATFARHVFGIEQDEDSHAASAGIQMLKHRFREMDLPLTLQELGVPESDWEGLTDTALRTVGVDGPDGVRRLPGLVPMDRDSILEVFVLASQAEPGGDI